MGKGTRLLLSTLVLGASIAVVGTAFTAAWNWFFRGELGLTREALLRFAILGLLIAAMPVGLMWARSRKE